MRTSLVREIAATFKKWIEGVILEDVLTGWLMSFVVLVSNKQFLLPVGVAHGILAKIPRRGIKFGKRERTWPVEMF